MSIEDINIELGNGDQIAVSVTEVVLNSATLTAVGLNSAHRLGDGSDHANVALNDSHRLGDGSDHANVALNDSHRLGDGSDHANVATNTAKLATIESGAQVNTVDSVNGATGVVVLDADDIDDTATTNKFVTATDITNLGNLSGVNTGDQTLVGLGGVTSASTGLISGGLLSVGTPNTTFSITDGSGVIVDNTVVPPTFTPVSWSGKTNIPATYVTSGLISFVGIDINGDVFQKLTSFTNAEHRQYIQLGSLIHVNQTNLDTINQFGEVAISPLNQLSDLSEALGKFNIQGNIFSPNGANLLLNKTVGKVHAQGSNWAVSPSDPNVVVLPELIGLTFQYRFQTGLNGATGTNIDPNIYDVAGVSTAVPNNKVTIQRIYSFVSNNVKIQAGQTIYNSISDAKAELQNEQFNTEPSIAANGVLRGFLVVKQGATDLTNPTQAFFYEAGKFTGQVGVGGQSVSSLQNAYDNSLNPEVITDATHGAVTFKEGQGNDALDVVEVLNGAGTQTFSVTGDGVVTGTSFVSSGLTKELAYVQTRDQAIYSATYLVTEIIDPLDLVVTAETGMTAVDLEFNLSGYWSNYYYGFIVTKDNVVLPDAQDLSNNYWSVIANFGNGTVHTSNLTRSGSVKIRDNSPSIGVAVTYRIELISTYTVGTIPMYFNRQPSSGGANAQASLMSSAKAVGVY